MATSIEKISMDLKAESSSGKCLVETEHKPDLDGTTFRKPSGRKKRILYDREFLIKCFHSPASAKKPSGFPIPHLDCTLGASKIKRLPLSAPQQQAYLPPKRKEEGAKRDRDGEDNISLRPHSGNFSGGCGPNLTSPSHVPSTSSFSRIHTHEEPSKGYDRDRDRDFHRNNFRYGGGHNRRDMNDRNRGMDRDRDREMDRDHRDRMNRDRLSGSNHRGNNWSNDGQDSDWSRRRNGAHFPRDRDYNTNSNKRYGHDRRDDEEPEWFSGGPSDRHETIELRGFLDDDRRDKSDDLRNGYEKESLEHNGEIDSGGESAKNDKSGESESPMDLSIEKILKMDHIPGILPNDMLESEEPSGSSRFSQFFKRNSATPDPGLVRAAHFEQHENNSHTNNGDKSKAVHEMGELLRNMLIKKNAPVESTPDPKPKEAAKPSPATKDDVDAFKKLVTPLLEKVLMGPAASKKASGKPPGGEQGQAHQGGNVMDLFKTPPQQNQQKSQSTPVPEDGPRSNPLQDIFNNMMNKQSAPVQPQEEVIRMTPNQALLMLPPELQQLVLNMNVSQNDYIMLVNLAKSNEWTFRSVLNGVMSTHVPPQQHMAYVGIFKLLIIGAVNLPGVVVINPNSQPMHPMPQPMPNHRPPNFEKIMQRPNDDGPKEMTKRSATPVSSMAFTPTSVMRKMTADGGKSVPPTNPTGFVPVPISGGLLPTPPTTAPVIMNSNNPNLASLMSTMARPHPHMQFRPGPPPMGFPPNSGFHPSMMTANMHGQVMIPPQFQNILPNQQPIYNKSEEN